MLGKRRCPPQRAFVCKWKCLCTLPHLMLCSLCCSQGLVDKNDIIVSMVSYCHCWYLCMTDPHILQAGLGGTKPYSRPLTSGDHKRCDSESEPPFETHNVWGEYSQCAQMWRDAIAWGWGRWYFGAGLPFVHNCTMHKLQRTALELPNIFCALCPCRQLSRMFHLVTAMCSLVKSYFSHMSNDAVGCGWEGAWQFGPTGHLDTRGTKLQVHMRM